MEEIAGLPEVGKLFTGYMTDLEQARQFDRAIDQLSLDKIWNGFVEAHGFEEDSSLNKFVLAHQLGKDLVFVASLFVGIGEINSFFKIANLLKKIKGVLSIRVIRLVKKLRKNLDTNDWKKLNSLSDLNEAFLAKLDGMGDQARRLLNDFDTETLKLFVDRPGLIDSWKVLDDAREANLADRLDDIEFVDDYVNSSGKTHAQVKTAIDNADGFSAWKLAEGGTTGIKVIDDFLALAPKIDNISPNSLPTGYQIVTKNGSKYIRRIDASNVNTPRLMVDETGTIVQYVKPSRLSSNSVLRNRLKQANGGVIPDGHQAHHIVPDNVVQNSPIHQEAINRGLYDLDKTSNGKLLAETAEDYVPLSEAYPTHFGSHPNYDGDVINAIDDVLDAHNVLPSQVSNLSDSKLLEIIDDIEGEALGILEDWIPSKLN